MPRRVSFWGLIVICFPNSPESTMSQPIVSSDRPILLVGGGGVDKALFSEGLRRCSTVVAADGGADAALACGVCPDAVIGDLDSVSGAARAAIPADRIHHIAEQDSTDFDKALRSVKAPLVIGVGFTGQRIDHLLSAMNVLVRHATRPCVLLGDRDVIAACPPSLDLDLPVGSRVSLFPLASVQGRSEGLHWPIDGLTLSPGGTVSTSNRSSAPLVRLRFDAPGMLIILPRQALDALVVARTSPG